MMAKNKKSPVSVEEQVLIEYLIAFLPADQADREGIILKSTQDIQDDLSDMVELSLSDIASVMRDTGYHIHVDEDNLPRWMMVRNK